MKLTDGMWGVVLLAGLLASLATGWMLHKPVDYGYGFWYDQMEIDQHIERYGPKNRYIRGFNHLTRDDHLALFGGIVDAVHSQGQGLRELEFTDRYGRTKPLLREPEVVHLQDVANLIDVLSVAGAISLLGAAVGSFVLARRRIAIRWKQQGLLLGGLLGGLGLVLVVAGPTAVFYQLHVWIFPDDHQWFFYYQESLMSTMMKAPDLFGGIGATIGVVGILLFSLYLLLIGRLVNRPQ
ncbi:DUF1461 domain-containing protein [uncultured Thalassolituus sp.]|uniref:lipoprotein intramolecular transacylase Lit n=1 Tax=uncultured Thalassolituus sp. TaxID=285273 RepID=UPI00261DB357|nr:DUF1461 domain-containing protein [uncultured Thalassolituus sp.]